MSFTNVDKLYFPAAKFSKGDVIRYYIDVAPVLLPHFRDRPVTLIRFPEGVRGEKFYEKNAPGFAPDWVQTTHVPRSEGGFINYILVNDVRTLAWCANLGAIELHPFLHRADDIQRPTHLAFDLDPGEGADLLTCIEVAFLVREVLAGLKLEAFPKVSGSKGLQLYVPLHTSITYDAATPFAKAVAELLHQRHPDLIVSDMLKALRVNKVLIDWSQNHEKKTTAGPYILRAKREEPFVSLPVTWDELKAAHKAGDRERLFFTPADALKRIAKHGDLFAPVLKLKQRLPASFVTAAAPRHHVRSPKAPTALATYAAKRDFSRTAEPGPALPSRSAQGSRRRFVIQKHAASHLHYDFRLEMDDTLKSWAVPKGLPADLDVKRSAFQTEDHPIEYLSFEGTIPQGQYGGGTVMVWDIGTYDLIGGSYSKGDLKLYLSGRKLKGEWHIFRIKSDDAKPVWLIRKSGEPHKAISAKQDDQSVLTKRTMAQIAADKSAVWQSNRTAAGAASVPAETTAPSRRQGRPPPAEKPARAARARAPRRQATREKRTTGASKRSAKAEPATDRPAAGTREGQSRTVAAPQFVEVMAAREAAELPAGDDWVYEIKLDGYRGLGIKHGASARVLSRNDRDLSSDFPRVIAALKTLPVGSAMLDGEIVALDGSGKPAFQLLQNRRTSEATVVYYAFDLLELEGEDWRTRPLHERKAQLTELVAGTDVRLSASFDGPPRTLIAEVQRLGLEGIIAKRRDSRYESGERSGAWVKLKLIPEQEFVIGGYKPGNPLESLVVGYYDGKRLMCAGKVRQGLNPRLRRDLAALLDPDATAKCPFANLPNSQKSHWGEGITAEQMKELRWVKPRHVAQVSFVEWTSGGNLRHGTFKGLRHDKGAREVVRELR